MYPRESNTIIMTTRHQIELESVSLLAVAAFVGIFLAVFPNHRPRLSSSFSLPVMNNYQNQEATISPLPKTITFSQVSPDGTHTLTMITTGRNTTKTYTITTTSDSAPNPLTIYSTTLPDTESINIPFNTWSPDNKYVFLEHKTQQGTEALVMKASGEALSADASFYNVTSLFTAKNTGNTYDQTTGWASETLLIVNTKLPDGSKGPSYWFEVPSKAIIQLSTAF